MSRIKSRDTSPEIIVRKYLFHRGFRYRKHVLNLPGKPDIVLKKYMSIILIQGCFWHQHPNCKRATFPKSNIEYWRQKLDANVEKDKNNQKEQISIMA